MTIEQTIEIPASRQVQFSPEVPVGRFRIVFFPAPIGTSNTAPWEAMPKVTRAQLAEWRKDPVIQELDKLSRGTRLELAPRWPHTGNPQLQGHPRSAD